MTKSCRFFLFILATFFLLMASASCSGYGGLKFTDYQYEDSVHLFHRSDFPFCRYSLNLKVADRADEEGLADYVNSVLLEEIFPGVEQTLPDVDAAARSAWKDYQDHYREDLEDIIQDAVDEGEPIEDNLAVWMGYYRYITTRVACQKDEHLCMEVMVEDYTGGAHEYAYSQMLNMDLKNRKVLSLEDLFTDDFHETLCDRILERLLKDYRASDLEELEDKGIGVLGPIEPSNNFILSDKTITFIFNPYDIASWADGRIDVELELSDLKDILKP